MFQSKRWCVWAYVLFHLLVVIAASQFCYSAQRENSLSVLAVGQGDALLIKTTTGHTILIDTGPDKQVLSALDDMMTLSDRSIDLIFLTHPHADHIGGFLDVIRRYQVGGVVMSNVTYPSSMYDRVIDVIQEQHIR